jgi:hypothetical protein
MPLNELLAVSYLTPPVLNLLKWLSLVGGVAYAIQCVILLSKRPLEKVLAARKALFVLLMLQVYVQTRHEPDPVFAYGFLPILVILMALDFWRSRRSHTATAL